MSKMIDTSGNTLVNVTTSALPTGAATATKQDTGNTSVASIDTKTPALVSGRVPVDGSGVTQPVSAASLPLPAGAATAAKQPALGTAGTASADVISVQGVASMTPVKVDGAGTAATNFVPVRLSDGTNFLTASQDATHDAAANTSGPQLHGYGSAAAPTDVSADGDAVRLWALKNGTLAVNLRNSSGAEVSVGGGTQYAEDAASAGGEQVTLAGAVRQDTLASSTSADGDIANHKVDSLGRLYVAASVTQIGNNAVNTANGVVGSGTQRVTIASDSSGNIATIGTSVTPGTGAANLGKAEDAAAASGDTGVAVLAVRRDVAASGVSADGDYANLSVDSNGALRVTGGGGGTQYNIDDVASATATGTFALAVRKDSAASLAGADGDVTGLQVDASGALRVTGGGGGTQYTEDAAAAADPSGNALIMVRKDTLAGLTSADGDNVAARGTDKGELYVKHVDAIPVTDNGSTLSIDDGAGSITVDGTVSVSGSVAVTNADLTTLAGAVRAEDAASADGHTGIPALAVRKATPANTSGADGDYEMLQMSAGRLWASATIDAALPAGTNAIGKLAANSGVDIGDVDVITMPESASVITDDAAFTPATTKVQMAGFTADETSTDSIDEGDGGAARMTLDRKQIHVNYAHKAGGWLPATGSIGATKTDIGTANTPGQVGGWFFYNPNASVVYVQFFNAQASAVTLGTTAPLYSIGIPASSAANVFGLGIEHSTAICIAITTTRAGATGPGSTVDYNVFYKQ